MTHPRHRYFSLSLGTALAAALIFGAVSACTNGQAKTGKPNLVFKDAPSAGVVAKIGDENITEETLIGEDKLDFFDLKKREYELKMDRLNRLIVEKLVGAEAKAAGQSLDEYIEKKVTKGPIKISDGEYKAFVKDKKIPDSQITPQIKERINTYLQTQKRQDLINEYVAKLTKKNPVEVYFTKPKMNIQVDIGQAPTYGKEGAPVTVIEFSDFQCPFCSRGADTVTELKKKYGNKIRIAFKHFPLPMHPQAGPASQASMCMNEQSGDKFWKFHDIAFKNQDKLDDASLEAHAKAAGGDMAKFKECYASKKYADFVQKDLAYGESLGVKSTPTFFVNGQLIAGAVPIEQFAEIIDEALAEAKK